MPLKRLFRMIFIRKDNIIISSNQVKLSNPYFEPILGSMGPRIGIILRKICQKGYFSEICDYRMLLKHPFSMIFNVKHKLVIQFNQIKQTNPFSRPFMGSIGPQKESK